MNFRTGENLNTLNFNQEKKHFEDCHSEEAAYKVEFNIIITVKGKQVIARKSVLYYHKFSTLISTIHICNTNILHCD